MAANFDVMNSTEEQNELQNAAANQQNAAEMQQKPNINRRKYKMIVFKNLAETQQNQTDNQQNQTVNQQNQQILTENPQFHILSFDYIDYYNYNLRVERFSILLKAFNSLSKHEATASRLVESLKQKGVNIENTVTTVATNNYSTNKLLQCSIQMDNGLIAFVEETHEIKQIAIKLAGQLLRTFIDKLTNLLNNFQKVYRDNKSKIQIFNDLMKKKCRIAGFIRIEESELSFSVQIEQVAHFTTVTTDREHKNKAKEQFVEFLKQLSAATETRNNHNVLLPTTSNPELPVASQQVGPTENQQNSIENQHNSTENQQFHNLRVERFTILLKAFNSLSKHEATPSRLVESLKQKGVNIENTVTTVGTNNEATNKLLQCSIEMDNGLIAFVGETQEIRQEAIKLAGQLLRTFIDKLTNLLTNFQTVYSANKSKIQIFNDLVKEKYRIPGYIRIEESELSFSVQIEQVAHFTTDATTDRAVKKRKNSKAKEQFVEFLEQLFDATETRNNYNVLPTTSNPVLPVASQLVGPTENQQNSTENQQNSTEYGQIHDLRVERFTILLKAFKSLSKKETIASRLVESLKQKGVNIENTVTTVATNNEATNNLLQCSIQMDNGLIAFVGETQEIRQKAIKLAGKLLRTFIDKLTKLLNNFQTVYRDNKSKIQIFNDLMKRKFRLGYIRIEESELSFSVQIEQVAHFTSVTTDREHKNKAKEQLVGFLEQLCAATETQNNSNVLLPTTSNPELPVASQRVNPTENPHNPSSKNRQKYSKINLEDLTENHQNSTEQPQHNQHVPEGLASLLNAFNSLSSEEKQISVLVAALKHAGVKVQVSTDAIDHDDDTIQHKCSVKVDNRTFVSRPNKSRQDAINSAVIMLAAFFHNLNSLVRNFKRVYSDKKSKVQILSQLKQACKPDYIETVESESSFCVQIRQVFASLATGEEGRGAADRKQKVAQQFVAFVQQLARATTRQDSSSSAIVQKLRSSIQSRELHDESYLIQTKIGKKPTVDYKILLGQFESFQGTIEEKFDNFLHSWPVKFKTKQLDNGQMVIQEIVLDNGAKFDDSSKSENSNKSSKEIIGQKLFKYLRNNIYI